jgi:hypothetical protein
MFASIEMESTKMRRNRRKKKMSVLEMMTREFGDLVRSQWVYDEVLCPCCRARPVGTLLCNGMKALVMNTYLYRERKVLISYGLCGSCAPDVINETDPTRSPLHDCITRNLIDAYARHAIALS